MTIADLGLVGSANNKTSGTTLAITNSSGSTIPADTLLVLSLTMDNAASTTAQTLSLSTGATGTWTQRGTTTGSGVTTTAGAGIWGAVFSVRTNAAITNGSTITTITFGTATVAKAAIIEGFTGVQNVLRNTVASGVSTTGSPTATTTGTALVTGDLVYGTAHGENNAAPTADADTLNGSWDAVLSSFTTGSTAATNVTVGAQDKVITATGAQTYNPTGMTADSVAFVMAFIPDPNIAASDTCAVTITDTSAVVVQISTSDDCAITITDSSVVDTGSANISASDTAAITITESSAIVRLVSAVDSAGIQLRDAGTGGGQVPANTYTFDNGIASGNSITIGAFGVTNGFNSTYSSSAAIHGPMGANIGGALTSGSVQYDIPSNNFIASAYFKINSLAAGSSFIALESAASNQQGFIKFTTSGNITISNRTNTAVATSTNTITAGTPFRVDIVYDVSSGTTVNVTAYLYLSSNGDGPLTEVISGSYANTATVIRWGPEVNSTSLSAGTVQADTIRLYNSTTKLPSSYASEGAELRAMFTTDDPVAVTITEAPGDVQASAPTTPITASDTCAITVTEGPGTGGGGAVGTPQTASATIDTNTSSTSTSVAYPATVNAGDLLLICMQMTGTGAVSASGYTDVAGVPLTGVYGQLWAAYMFATGSEGGTTVSVSHPTGGAIGTILAFPSVDTVNPIDSTPTEVNTGVGSSSTILPSLTATVDGVALVSLATLNGTTQTATEPSGFTEVIDASSGSPGVNKPTEVAYQTGVLAGATGTETVAWTASAKNAGILIPLRPATSGVAGQVIISSSVSGSESTAITITEASAVADSSTRTDTTAVTVTETSAVAVSQPTSDTTAVTVTENSAVLVQISAFDTCAITITESDTTLAGISANDTTAITISDASQSQSTLSASDTTAVTIAETSSVGVQTLLSTSDTTAVTIADTSSVLILVSASDTCAVTITDTDVTMAGLSTTESVAITISDASQSQSTLSTTDTTAVTITESSNPAPLVPGNETIAVSISEVSSPLVIVNTADTCAITISESDMTMAGVTANQPVAVTITDVSSSVSTLSTTDQAAITIADASTSTSALSTTDTTAVTIAETSATSGTVTTTDSTAITIVETSGIFYALSTTDTCAITIADTSSNSVSGANNVSTSDTAAITIADTSAVAVTLSVTANDTCAVTITEAPSSISGTVATTESVAVTIADSSASASTLSRTDTSAITITDSSSVGQFTNFPGSETVAVTIAESSSVQISGVVAISASDTTAVTISDSSSVAQTLQVAASDNCAITVNETSSIAGTVVASDTTALSIDDQSLMFKNVDANDTAALTITESSNITTVDALLQLTSSDDLVIAVNEHINVIDPFSGAAGSIRSGGHTESKNNFASELVNGTMVSEQTTQNGIIGGEVEQQTRVE